jgi:hypothetical protein
MLDDGSLQMIARWLPRQRYKGERNGITSVNSARDTVYDCLILSLVALFSFILYVDSLGFYSDDWGFLMLLSTSNDQSFFGLTQALYSGDSVIRQRPSQVIYLAALYWLFGVDPLGYHLSNGVVLVSSILLFYLIVREFEQPRLLAVSLPLVYALLPHYSTDRFWVAAFQATLSIALYLLSLYANLRALRARPIAVAGWKALGVLSLVVGILAYEVTLPFFLLLNPVLLWYRLRQLGQMPRDGKGAWDKLTLLLIGDLLALAAVILFKISVSVRINTVADYGMHIANLVAGSFRVNFGTYGLGLPYIVWWILQNAFDWEILALSLLLGLVIFGYLFVIAKQPRTDLQDSAFWPKLATLGLFIFGLGYAIFLTSADVWFTSTSLGNRIAIGAALGVAILFVATIGWLCRHLWSRRIRIGAFCLLITSLCLCGFLINNTLAAFWIAAYRQQQAIVQDIRTHFSALPAGTTLILDGVCLEHGGAYIFTGKRDLAGVLIMAYRDRSLWATVISHSPKIEADGLTIETYGTVSYPYSDRLLVYNITSQESARLTDAATTQRYFQSTAFKPERDCPAGFAWNWNAATSPSDS